MRRVLKIALASAALGLATPALAATAVVNGTTLDTAGTNSTTVHFGGPAGSTASADLFLQLTSASSGVFNFNYAFTNTNAAVSNLVNFGFTTESDIAGHQRDRNELLPQPEQFPGRVYR